MTQHLSYRDWYRNGPYAGIPQETRTFHAGAMQVINVSPPPGAVVEAPIPEYALHLLLQTAPLLRVGFDRTPRWLAVSPGSMILAPPDTACEYVADAPAHVLTIAIPKACADEFAEHSGTAVGVRGEEAFRNPRLSTRILKLWEELADGAPSGELFVDQEMRALLDALARRTHPSADRDHGREQLAAHTVRRLRDYIESSLGEDLDVTQLAAVAGLSAAHFARAFAATVGMTPFRYVMTRRLARAREMLTRSRRPALDIALDVGFKTPSHFAARFRNEFGVTPREMRARRP